MDGYGFDFPTLDGTTLSYAFRITTLSEAIAESVRGIDVKYFWGIQMSRGSKVAVWAAVVTAVAGGLVTVLLIRPANWRPSLTLKGVVLRRGTQADKELPLANVKITAGDGLVTASCKSDSTGFFKLTLPGDTKSQEPIILQFRRHGYWPLDLRVVGAHRLYVAKLISIQRKLKTRPKGPQVPVSNISVRYSVKTTTDVNVGSSVKTFQVINTGNVPCQHKDPCSPGGQWKAAKATVSLDAGIGNVFHDARVSCIAGPCPFTRITPHSFPRDKRTLSVTAFDWSDTATFLVEAEVFHPMVSEGVRKSYPVIFGRVLHFTVPPSAEGVCIKAEIGGTHIIFPLGPKPRLLWADCNVSRNKDRTKAYRCELRSGYRF